MTSKTSITYGGALYDLAKDEGLSAQILADLGQGRRLRQL